MLIRQLAQKTSSTKDTIRHYRELGLLRYTKRSSGSRFYYDYDESNIETIETILLGKEMGLTLKQMVPLIERFLAGEFSVEQQIQYYSHHLDAIEKKLKSLETVRKTLLRRIAALKASQSNI